MSEVKTLPEAIKSLNVFLSSDLGAQFQIDGVLPMLKFTINL